MTTLDPTFIPACQFDELPDGSTKAVSLDGQNLLLCHNRGTVFAIENRCSHQNTPLTEGRVRNGYISCPLHGVRFELATGKPTGQLTRVSIRTFAVEVKNGVVNVDLHSSGQPSLGDP